MCTWVIIGLLLLFSCPIMSDSAIPWTAARQACLCFTNSWSLPEFISIALVMPSSHHIFWHPFLLLLSIFLNIRLFSSDDQSTGLSASASVLLMRIQAWLPIWLTALISLLSKGLSGVFSSTTVQGINSSVFCLLYGPAVTTVCDHWEDHSLDCMDLCPQSNVSAFNTLSRFVITFLPRSNHLLISWLQSPSAVILELKKRKSVTTSTLLSSICHEVMGLEAMILVF